MSEQGETKTITWFREQVGFRIVQIKTEALKNVEKRMIVLVIGHRLYDDLIAGIMKQKDDPKYREDFAIVSSNLQMHKGGVAVHFMGAAVMAGSREEFVHIPAPTVDDPDNTIRRNDPGYIHPWSYRIDWFVFMKDNKRIERPKVHQGKIVLCPIDQRLTHGEDDVGELHSSADA